MTSQFGEDDWLWARLNHVEKGRYVDVGAGHPVQDSISWSFYQRGWRGITVEPVPGFALEHAQVRPDDIQRQCVAGDVDGQDLLLYVFDGTHLSTLVIQHAERHIDAGRLHSYEEVRAWRLDTILADHWTPGDPIHFMTIDTEGFEDAVLAGLDLAAWRPWYLIIESTEPNTLTPSYASWEPTVLGAGYVLEHTDTVNRYYRSEVMPLT